MEQIEAHGVVKEVVPKHGKARRIKVVLDLPYSQEKLTSLADAMMQNDEGVDVTFRYEPTPLFQGGYGQGEMFEEEGDGEEGGEAQGEMFEEEDPGVGEEEEHGEV